jgi:hypothetical protein
MRGFACRFGGMGKPPLVIFFEGVLDPPAAALTG